jgi:hypothetical protein
MDRVRRTTRRRRTRACMGGAVGGRSSSKPPHWREAALACHRGPVELSMFVPFLHEFAERLASL